MGRGACGRERRLGTAHCTGAHRPSSAVDAGAVERLWGFGVACLCGKGACGKPCVTKDGCGGVRGGASGGEISEDPDHVPRQCAGNRDERKG